MLHARYLSLKKTLRSRGCGSGSAESAGCDAGRTGDRDPAKVALWDDILHHSKAFTLQASSSLAIHRLSLN